MESKTLNEELRQQEKVLSAFERLYGYTVKNVERSVAEMQATIDSGRDVEILQPVLNELKQALSTIKMHIESK